MTARQAAVQRALFALCALLLLACGDGIAESNGADATVGADSVADAVDVPDTAHDQADGWPVEIKDVAGDADGASEVLTPDATAADWVDAEDAVDAASDTWIADAVDVTSTDAPTPADAGQDADTADVVDAVGDTADAAVDALDPTCPYDPASYCLHWGVCKGGKITVDCTSGEPLCNYSAVIGYELIEKSCDGLDNDCNNLIDDSLKVPLASKQGGLCQGLMKTCQGKQGWQDPNFLVLPLYQSVETACDGQDNDCDGLTDVFQSEKKLVGFKGICADASYICDGANGWQLPDITTLPFWEPVETMCDGLDNDCDGLTDEDMDTANFLGSGVEVNNQGVCNGAPIRCLQGIWSQPDYGKQPGFEMPESSCDGLDNDCNGLTDELTPALASKQAGVCAGQELVCSGQIGWQDPDWTLLPGYATNAEWQCDGLDNDCDGLTDEDAACPQWQVGGRGRGALALSPDGQQLAWTTMQGVQVVDWQSRLVTRNWFGHDFAVTAVAFSADGTRLATVGQTDVLQVWPLAGPATPTAGEKPVLAVGGLGTTFEAVVFSPDGGQVAVGDLSGTVRVYALWSGKQVAALIGHKAAVAWLADGSGQNGVLLTGDQNGVVRRWQVASQTGQQMALMPGAVRAIVAMPGTTRVLLIADSQATVVDAANGEPEAQLLGGASNWVSGALRPDGGGEALLVETDGTVRRFALPAPAGLFVDVTPTQTLVPPPDVQGDAAVSLVARSGHVAVGFVAQGPWQLDLAAASWSRATTRHAGAVHDVAITGDLLLSGGDDTAIRLWRAADGESLTALWGHQGAVLAIQPLTQLPNFPPGSPLAILLSSGLGLASGSDDFTVRLWSVTPTAGGIGVLTPKIFGLGGPWPDDLALTADVPGIWAAGGPTLSKISTDPAKLGQKLNAYPTKLGNVIERVVPSPDGQWLALGLSGDGAALNVHYRIIAAKTFAVLHEWSGMPAPVHAVAWSGDGARVALAGPDGVIQIAEVQSGAVVQQLFGHTGAITGLTWSVAGRLLSTSEDGTARVWAAPVGKAMQQIAVFSRHCPAPCSATTGGEISVLGGVWRDAEARNIITFASDGSLFGWKGPAGP